MLSLSEKILLLALHDENGKFLWSASLRLPYCLAGGFLMDLALKKRINADSKLLKVIDRTPTGDSLLDNILKIIDASEKDRSPQYWISKIGSKSKVNKQELLNRLIDKGILLSEEGHTLWIFRTELYPFRDDRPKREIISNVRSTILRNGTPDTETVMLISLVYNLAQINQIFSKEERKDAIKKAKEISNSLPISKAITKAIQTTLAATTATGAGI